MFIQVIVIVFFAISIKILKIKRNTIRSQLLFLSKRGNINHQYRLLFGQFFLLWPVCLQIPHFRVPLTPLPDPPPLPLLKAELVLAPLFRGCTMTTLEGSGTSAH